MVRERTTNIALIAAEIGLTETAVRNILSRAGISIRTLRVERAARREIQPHSPAAELLRQANDLAVAEIRAASEKRRPVHADWEPALRALGFQGVGRRQARRAGAAVLAELRAQAKALKGRRVFDLPWNPSEQDWEPLRVIISITRDQERTVEECLSNCGITGGLRHFSAKLVSRERERSKYLVPRAAVPILEKIVTGVKVVADDDEEMA